MNRREFFQALGVLGSSAMVLSKLDFDSPDIEEEISSLTITIPACVVNADVYGTAHADALLRGLLAYDQNLRHQLGVSMFDDSPELKMRAQIFSSSKMSSGISNLGPDFC